jgi:nucleoside-diphosphate-sugar epimerase
VTRTAFVIGGTGQVGRAVVQRLLEAGWDVTAAARKDAPIDARLVRLDRDDDVALATAVGDGVDVLVDVIPYTSAHARQLVSLADRAGSIVAISSAAVYGLASRPRSPVAERAATVEPGDADYAAAKVAMERVLLDSGRRTTIVRPCAIHGPGSPVPRELFFVKRILDRRRLVVLAGRGASVFHTTSVANLAELIWLACERPGRRVLNCGDPSPPSALEIGRTICRILEHDWAEVLLAGEPADSVGAHPWGLHFVVDMLEAELELRYRPVTTYERAVEETVRWLIDARPVPHEYMTTMFDYAAEDGFVANLAG